MKKNEIIVAWIGGIIILIACVYPPWTYTFQETGISQVSKPAGHYLIFEPPSPEFGVASFPAPILKGYGVELDFGLLSIEIFAILIITILVILSLRYYSRS